MIDYNKLEIVADDDLVSLHKKLKAEEEVAKENRVKVEYEFYRRYQGELPASGTHKLACGMKIVTGFSDSWNQETLAQIKESWVDSIPFPFTVEFKPNSKEIAYIKDKFPALYKRLQDALTQKEKKPSFSVATTKGGNNE